MSGSSGSKNGGVAFGKLAKLLANYADVTLAIALAFRIAKGFFPVRVV